MCRENKDIIKRCLFFDGRIHRVSPTGQLLIEITSNPQQDMPLFKMDWFSGRPMARSVQLKS